MSNIKCPLEYTVGVIGGKWKMVLLWRLSKEPVKRYGELKQLLAGISHKMLSQQLKELESSGLITRKEYHQIPPKVEYSLSEKGKTIVPLLINAYNWGKENMSPN